ncbi:MAG: hypothetical protein D6761_06680 [Candidatus Dadabacteria bacterium]|nr:MAG: hypothetical protein D6761_06680 [Candidatus Dadabacteria bacterium]
MRLTAIEAELDDLRLALRATTDRLLATHRDLARREAIYTGSILGDARFARTSARAAYEGGAADVFVPIEATARYLRAEREYASLVAMRRSVEARLLALSGTLAPVRTRPTPSEDQLVGDSE